MINLKNTIELRETLQLNPYVIFGAGNIAQKTYERLKVPAAFILDNNLDIAGSSELGFEVLDARTFLSTNSLAHNCVYLICSTSILEIEDQLLASGIQPDRIFLSPLLHQVYSIIKFEASSGRFLLASGLQNTSPDGVVGGGGLYEITYSEGHDIKKILTGPTHSIISYKNRYVAVCEKYGLAVLSSNYELLAAHPVPKGDRPHGICFSEYDNSFLVACSYSDKILIFDTEFNQTGSVGLSDLYDKFSSPQHHCNDIFAIDGLAYVSMFSVSGNWKRGIFDGGLIVVDIAKQKVIDKINLGLTMPHTVSQYQDDLMILDSLNGRFLANGMQEVLRFNGFARGFTVNQCGHVIVGLSKNRNYTRILDNSAHVPIDNSVVITCPQLRISRSIALPRSISEIHGLLSI